MSICSATPFDMGSAPGPLILAPIARLRLYLNLTPIPPDFKTTLMLLHN